MVLFTNIENMYCFTPSPSRNFLNCLLLCQTSRALLRSWKWKSSFVTHLIDGVTYVYLRMRVRKQIYVYRSSTRNAYENSGRDDSSAWSLRNVFCCEAMILSLSQWFYVAMVCHLCCFLLRCCLLSLFRFVTFFFFIKLVLQRKIFLSYYNIILKLLSGLWKFYVFQCNLWILLSKNMIYLVGQTFYLRGPFRC